jgi:hypothetical protein
MDMNGILRRNLLGHSCAHGSKAPRRPALPLLFGLALISGLIADFASTARADVYIDKSYPITRDGVTELSPPNIEATSDCTTHVYVDSFVPKATVHVYLGAALIGSATPDTGFAAIAVNQQLHPNDTVTATQTVNGITSAHSQPAIIGALPANLPTPTVGTSIYACGRVVPVQNLLSGVDVTVTDLNTGKPIGSGSTPNLWGSDWVPVGTAALVAGHKISATQTACTTRTNKSNNNAVVLTDPTPMTKPALAPPIVGNDTVTVNNLYTGALIKAENTATTPATTLGGGYATGSSNWLQLPAPITAADNIQPAESLCAGDDADGPAQKPVAALTPPILLGPICPGQAAVMVSNSVLNATLVLRQNGVVVGYGGAAPGDAPLTIAPHNAFALNDTVDVVQYINAIVSAPSNSVKVGCTNDVTYHNNNQRTGWNETEQVLTPANVGSPQFKLLQTVALDDQVDGQPLVVTQQTIKNSGVHDVVYVATENNTVYGIDVLTGAVLLKENFGTPVPMSVLPGQCNNNAAHIGITSTPVIDPKTATMYVIVYSYESNAPIYRIHALSLDDLVDKMPPVEITASNTLSDGTAFTFSAQTQRQRSGLLLANGAVYAGFASFCDISANNSRGWLLGWEAATLKPLAANELTNHQTVAQTPPSDHHDFFLSSIWMSGYGVAADADGDLFFVTGNSDTVRTDNIQESAVRMSPDLTAVKDYFTPSNFVALDQQDLDYASGGLMVLPDQSGPLPHLAVAAGKYGLLYIIDRDNMGKYVAGGPDKPPSVNIVWCHCGPSYFVGSDGVSRVVSSGDTVVKTWKVDTAKAVPLTLEATSASLFVSSEQSSSGIQDSGFFTTISSNGTQANTAIIWAVSRPDNKANPTVSLYAFNTAPAGTALPKLFSDVAGTWPSLGGNANIVPVVANGRVYVASYKKLTVFGLAPTVTRKIAPRQLVVAEATTAAAPAPAAAGAHVAGTIASVDGNQIVVRLRNGDSQNVDLTAALKANTAIPPFVGETVEVTGTTTAGGVLAATTMLRARGLDSLPPDQK